MARARGSGPLILDRVFSVPLTAILLVAAITVHWQFGFSSIKLRAVTAAGPQFGPPGYETDLLYICALATLVIGGSGPWRLDEWIGRQRHSGPDATSNRNRTDG